MTKEIETIYQQRILDHYRRPSNYGPLTKAAKTERGHNLLCGDEVSIQVYLKDNLIKDIKFQAQGCAISIASASILTEAIKGKKLTELKTFNQKTHLKNLGLNLSPTRLKCALLCYETFSDLVKD